MRRFFWGACTALLLIFAAVAPAVAQRYTAKRDGDVVTLMDTAAKMKVAVYTPMGRAWQVQVDGHNLVLTAPSLEDFKARAGLTGIPLLAPFANRLDQTAFYANGKKYTFDLGLGNVRGPIPGTGFVNGNTDWKLVGFNADAKSAWVTCRLDFYRIPEFMKQFPFAHTITMTYRVSKGALEVHTRLDNLSDEPMPVVIGFHPIYELPDGNRNDWTVALAAKTHWIEIPERLPTGETQPTEAFFNADQSRTAIHLKNYGLLDDVFTNLVRGNDGRATMRLMYDGKEMDESLGPNFKTILLWSPPLPAAAAFLHRGPFRPRRPGSQAQEMPSGPYPVDPAKGEKTAPRAVPPAAGAPAPDVPGFIAMEPMVAITDALNLAQKGVYKDLQSIPPGGSWEGSFWITAKGF